MGSEMKAEPNLTPLLDVVFQLITFFMLLINFSTENYDQRVRLPVAGTARPIEEGLMPVSVRNVRFSAAMTASCTNLGIRARGTS